MGTHYIGPITTFMSGVVKIQRQEFENLSGAEKEACECLLLEDHGDQKHASDTSQQDAQVSIDDIIERTKRLRLSGQSEYRNCDFILGSVAEVDRLWSVAENVRTVNRKVMTPLMFKCVMFLKINKSYWRRTWSLRLWVELGLKGPTTV